MTPEPSELEALLALRLTPGLGDLGIRKLLDRFGSARAVLNAGPGELRVLTRGRVTRLPELDSGVLPGVRDILARARNAGMDVLGYGLSGYPERLSHLVDPPPVVFVQGRRELLERPAVAIVGTRRATGSGRRMSRRLGQAFSMAGIPVVSGLALGVDGEAHVGALGGEGSTIAVLASGLDRVYPRSHRRLQHRIRQEGLLVGEFPPGEEAQPYSFPRRNRIVAALARSVVVVEAGRKSGALITADHALDLGRDVFAVPGCVEYAQSQGTLGLLREGARLITDPEDLLEAWQEDGIELPGSADRAERPAGASRRDPHGLMSVLEARPQPAEVLGRRTGLPPATLMRALVELELEGGATREPAGWRATHEVGA